MKVDVRSLWQPKGRVPADIAGVLIICSVYVYVCVLGRFECCVYNNIITTEILENRHRVRTLNRHWKKRVSIKKLIFFN